MTENLRYGTDYKTVDILTHLDFSREGGFAAAIEMCNGAGVCRKTAAGTMCPSYMATRRTKRTRRVDGQTRYAPRSPARGLISKNFTTPRTYEVLDLCLSCKACKTECPSSVDMAKIKTEFLAQYYDDNGTPFRAKMLGNVQTLNRIGTRMAPLANMVMRTPLGSVGKRMLGVHPKRELAPFASETFESWFQKRGPRREHGIVGWRSTITIPSSTRSIRRSARRRCGCSKRPAIRLRSCRAGPAADALPIPKVWSAGP
jgi:ferredoxin